MWFYTGIYDKLNNGDIKLYIFYKYYYLIKIIIIYLHLFTFQMLIINI